MKRERRLDRSVIGQTQAAPSEHVTSEGADLTASQRELFRWDHLTWPEVNEAAKQRKVVLLPIGSTEQHGFHLPLDTDNLLARRVCIAAARLAPGELLVMPNIPYGYNEHGLDFPGTISVSYETLLRYCLDVLMSVAHAGFDRILIVNGHGSNEPLCDVAARRATLQTDALVAFTSWWALARAEFEEVRDSPVGGAAHACEMETSAYLYLAPQRVQLHLAEDEIVGSPGVLPSRFIWGDLTKGTGPVKLVGWTSSTSTIGVGGMPTLATAAKGEVAIESAAANMVAFCREFRQLEPAPRVDHRAVRPAHPQVPMQS